MRSKDVVRWYDYWEARPALAGRVSSGGVNIIILRLEIRTIAAPKNYRRSGEVDAMRIPKDGYFASPGVLVGMVHVTL
jgi:beta-galactosidase